MTLRSPQLHASVLASALWVDLDGQNVLQGGAYAQGQHLVEVEGEVDLDRLARAAIAGYGPAHRDAWVATAAGGIMGAFFAGRTWQDIADVFESADWARAVELAEAAYDALRPLESRDSPGKPSGERP